MKYIIIEGVEVRPCPSFKNYGTDRKGNVYRLDKKRKMATRITNNRGYKRQDVRVSIDNKAFTAKVHQMVADAWLGEKPSSLHTDVNHIDGDSTNNHVENLEWATKSQNQRHAVNTGLKCKGSELYNSTLTDQDVHEICQKLIDGALAKDLADAYNTSKDIIYKIRAGDTYFHIRSLYVIDHKYKFDYSDATIKWVCERIKDGYSDKGIVEISRNPNLTIIEIKRIRYKVRYKWISDQYF